MTQKLLLISLAREDSAKIYKKTVDPPLMQKTIKKFVLPSYILNSKKNSIWGLNETTENQKIWKSIKKSDIVLFLKDGKYFSKGLISYKMKNSEILSKIIKNSNFAKSRKLLLFIKELEQTNIDYKTTIPIFTDPVMKESYRFPIKIVNEKNSKLLLKTFGSIGKGLKFMENSKNEYTLSEYIDKHNLKQKTKFSLKVRKSKQRDGQTAFSKQVLKNFRNKCAVCRISQLELLEAGHIIPVNDEKLAGAINNGICFCKNCHRLFDTGYFSFDDNYRIIFSREREIDSILRNSIVNQNRMGKYLVEPSKTYLLYHRVKFNIF